MKSRRNPVAKHAAQYNKATVQVDRKRREKNGYQKYKKPGPDRAFFLKRMVA